MVTANIEVVWVMCTSILWSIFTLTRFPQVFLTVCHVVEGKSSLLGTNLCVHTVELLLDPRKVLQTKMGLKKPPYVQLYGWKSISYCHVPSRYFSCCCSIL